jgi:hypothetical protein
MYFYCFSINICYICTVILNLNNMSKRNIFIFKGLHIVAWIIFVGLCIDAGGLVVNFIFSLYKPEYVQNLYQKLDLSQMYNLNKWVYYGMYGFILAIAMLKATMFYAVIRLISKLNLSKPFSSYVADQITRISYYTLAIGLISNIARQIAKNLQQTGFEVDMLNQFWGDSQAYILMAAVIYVIATIFSRGVEIQNEIDLTV